MEIFNSSEEDKRSFERKNLIGGIPGFLSYFGQNEDFRTIRNTQVHLVTLQDITPKGAGLELILPRIRKNHEIKEIQIGDNISLHYVIPKKLKPIPKIEPMKIVNVNEILDQTKTSAVHSPYQRFRIGTEFLNNEKDEFIFLQSSKTEINNRKQCEPDFVNQIFGISQLGNKHYLPKNMDIKKNLIELGYTSF